MIFLCAQPDEYYFLWQIELLTYNLNSLGIPSRDIHVVIGYNPRMGLSVEFQRFIRDNRYANYYPYPDTRKDRTYIPSIKPHLIAKHLRKYPDLENEFFFLHDSDVVFRDIKNFAQLEEDEAWYCSDTRSYLSCEYINRTIGKVGLSEMCNVVGILPETAEKNDGSAGGAQYIIKNAKSSFWQKVEKDSTQLYKALLRYAKAVRKDRGFEGISRQEIQPWCAEMWATWWNTLLFQINFKISAEMDFCWADSPIRRWKETRILHYTGSFSKEEEKVFNKGKFILYAPFYADLERIDPESCSYALKEVLTSYAETKKERRHNLDDFTFLILAGTCSGESKENLDILGKYLSLSLKTNFLTVEISADGKFENELQSILTSKVDTPFVCVHQCDYILSIEQIIRAADLLRRGRHPVVYPYDGNILRVDRLMRSMFARLVDPMFLVENSGKCHYCDDQLANAVVFIKSGSDRAGSEAIKCGRSVLRLDRREFEMDEGRLDKVKKVPGNLFRLPG
jgi:hypothetical protein